MTFSFHPCAEKEFDMAVSYYEECRSGLGLEFAEEESYFKLRILCFAKLQ
jgi:hypothetical protein